jgi:hypothetical protein
VFENHPHGHPAKGRVPTKISQPKQSALPRVLILWRQQIDQEIDWPLVIQPEDLLQMEIN